MGNETMDHDVMNMAEKNSAWDMAHGEPYKGALFNTM